MTPWIYRNRWLTDADTEGQVGFLYVIMLPGPLRYVGYTTFNSTHNWRKYCGSGTLMTQWMKDNDTRPVRRVVLAIHDDIEELKQHEREATQVLNVVNDPMYLNLQHGGGGGNKKHRTEVVIINDVYYPSYEHAAADLGVSVRTARLLEQDEYRHE